MRRAPRKIDWRQRDYDYRSEKLVERAGDVLMGALGFTAIRLSQPRHTMQSRGIPDRRYYNPERRLVVWWEAKTEIGRPSASQVAFRRLVEAVGEEYVLGTDEALIRWAESKGLVERVGPNGIKILRPTREGAIFPGHT